MSGGPRASGLSYAYGQVHRLYETAPGNSSTGDTYDAVGNLVREVKGSTTKTYAYDADDRLWDITVGTAGMRYGYDNNGNRKWAYRCGRSRRESLRAVRGFIFLI